MIYQSFEDIISKNMPKNPVRMYLVAAEEEGVLRAAAKAEQEGYIEPVLVGKKDKILNLLVKNNIFFKNLFIINAEENKDKCDTACQNIAREEHSFLMKGMVETSDLIRSILREKKSLLCTDLISHVSLLELPYYSKILGLSDTSVNIKPSLIDKENILKNTVAFFHQLGYKNPKAAILSSIEKVNPKMQETIDAAMLKEKNLKGEISGCIVEGPISLDISISPKAAIVKDYKGHIQGDADILIAPDMVSGNLLGKCFNFTPCSRFAGFLLGTKCPVGLTSRASDYENKYSSMVLGAILTGGIA